LDGIIKTNKKGVSGHFVECYTRQRVSLLSAVTTTLGKKDTPENW
jgi:hypothetical protein